MICITFAAWIFFTPTQEFSIAFGGVRAYRETAGVTFGAAMTLAELSLYLFTCFNGARLISYVPQICRVARDANGATAISYLTWSLWTGANVSTGLYAFVNLGDLMLGVTHSINALCCTAVIVLTAYKRSRFARTGTRLATAAADSP